MLEGGCSCGSVRFAIEVTRPDVYVCHCSICRRSSGSNGVAVLVLPNAQFRWLQGEDQIATWRKPGADWQTWFCRQCGARLPGSNDAERMFIPAGALDDQAVGLRVVHHIWVDSRPSG